MPFGVDRLAGGSAFLLAGAAFAVLCFLCGFIALTSHGVDVPVPEPTASLRLWGAVATWLIGLAAAVGGLVVLIVTAVRGLAMLRWGAADLALQLALATAMVLALVLAPA